MQPTQSPIIEQLLNVSVKPCLSLYMVAHRTQPERRDDQTRYRALMRQLEDSLATGVQESLAQTLMAPFRELEGDEAFWNSRKEGIAVFSAPGFFEAHHLERGVPELAVVADSFHVKPLLRVLQTLDTYHVLTLTREHVALYVGDRDGLTNVDLGPNAPFSINDVLGEELTTRNVSRSSSGGAFRVVAHSTAEDEKERDTERFFRAIDRSIMEYASQPTGLPLILVGLPQHLSVFHQVMHNPNVLLEGVTVHPDGLPHKELVRRSWEVMEPYITKNSRALIDSYHEAAAKELGLDHVVPIATAASEGRVATLLVEANRQLPGKVDAGTGDIVFDDLNQFDVNDLLDDIATIVLRKGGRVLVLASEHMPTSSGAAAVLRY